jgi:hypothetical protein
VEIYIDLCYLWLNAAFDRRENCGLKRQHVGFQMIETLKSWDFSQASMCLK